MRKLLSMLLVICMVFSVVAPVSAISYDDCNNHWAKDAITRWSTEGILNGSGLNQFRPDDALSRAEAAAILSRLLKLTKTADITNYKDVEVGSWYYDVIAKCVAAGILQGVSSNQMKPNAPVTREEFFVMFARSMGIAGEKKLSKAFDDASSVSSWAEEYVNALINRGFVSGVTKTMIAPSQNITRASVAALMDAAIVAYITENGTVEVDGDGIVIVTADNVTIKGNFTGLVVKTSENAKVQIKQEVVFDNETEDNETEDNEQEEEKVANSIEDIFDYSDGATNSIADFLGVNFINPQYGIEDKNCILEAGARLEELGTKSVKFYLSPNYKTYYEPNIDWADYSSPAALAQDPSFDALMNMDFNTLFIGAYTFTESLYATYWYHSLTEEQKANEYQAMYDLTYYLCKEFEGSGKTFIIQNWEGDWSAMEKADPATDPSDEVLARMTEWINVRQDAVTAAREDAHAEGVRVYNALEVNLVDKAMKGGKTVTNNVIPNTYCDYYSYSAYDTEMDRETFGAALDYLKAKVAENQNDGKSRVYVGEYGLPENLYGTDKVLNVIDIVTEVAREKQMDYVLFWQLYDDGLQDYSIPKDQVTDEDCMGYWMIRPSNTKTAAWNSIYEKIHGVSDPEYVPEEKPTYTSLEINLGQTNEENGIKQLDLTDGMTTAGEIDGVPCRYTPGGLENWYRYMYFDADDDFITATDNELTIELTFYDEGTSTFYLDYFNAAGELKNFALPRTNTMQWRTETIRLKDVKFDVLHGMCDFRVNDGSVAVAVSNVKVWKGADVVGEIVLGGEDYVLSASGLTFLPLDGVTYQTETFAEQQCVSAPAGNHLWFDIDESVIGPSEREMQVTIEYYDNQPKDTGFVMYYTNGSADVVGYSSAVMFQNDNTWKTYTFSVDDAVINNLWWGDRDISFLSNASQVWVRSVTVSRPQKERTEVSIILKETPVQDGIELYEFAYDGSHKPAEKDGKECIATDPESNDPSVGIYNSMYFDTDDLFIPDTQSELYLSITFFDEGTDPFELQYNSSRTDDDEAWPGIATILQVERTGSNQWKTVQIHLADAQFKDKLQGLCDFRLCDMGTQLFVSKIVVAKAAPQ